MSDVPPPKLASAEYSRECDECGETTSRVAYYCPRCGAKLREGEHGE